MTVEARRITALPPVAIGLLDLPPNVLDHIIRLAWLPPRPIRRTVLLSICHQLRECAMSIVFRQLDIASLSRAACLRLALHLDPLFPQRTSAYINPPSSSRNRTQLLAPPTSASSSTAPLQLFPFDPDNETALTSSLSNPPFRLYTHDLRIYSTWDVSSTSIYPNWTSGGRGIPFAVVPVFLTLIRRALPNIRSIHLDLPKAITTTSQQNLATKVAEDVFDAICRFGEIEVLVLDCWAFRPHQLETLINRCCSLKALTVRRSSLTLALGTGHFALGTTTGHTLRRLTFAEPSLSLDTMPVYLQMFLNLESLQIVGYTYEAGTYQLDQFVAFFEAASTVGAPPTGGQRSRSIAPIQSLVLRPSYRIPSAPNHERAIRLTAFLVAISPTLRHLHLGIQTVESVSLLPLISGRFDRLEALWIGFMSAQDEVGESVRLTVADDRRVRPGLIRGFDVLGDKDPLQGQAETPSAASGTSSLLSAGAASTSMQLNIPYRSLLFTEQLVLARLRVEEDVIRSLVDPAFSIPWPPTHRQHSWGRMLLSLQPYPHLMQVFIAHPRTRPLQQLHVFEVDYVNALKKLRAVSGLVGWSQPGVRIMNSSDISWSRLMAGVQGR
ncbi:hypothetical protein T439DRAFT_202324 [Meredithblackwellia eburnea MCA 4105]